MRAYTGRDSVLQRCLDCRLAPFNIKRRGKKAKPKNPGGIERPFIRDVMDKRKDFLQQVEIEYRQKFAVTCKKLSFLDKLRFCKLLNLTTERLSQQIKRKNEKTIDRLLKEQHGVGVLRHSIIVNLVDVELTNNQNNVLCRGLGYGVLP